MAASRRGEAPISLLVVELIGGARELRSGGGGGGGVVNVPLGPFAHSLSSGWVLGSLIHLFNSSSHYLTNL